jgi:hypothetical protein
VVNDWITENLFSVNGDGFGDGQEGNAGGDGDGYERRATAYPAYPGLQE